MADEEPIEESPDGEETTKQAEASTEEAQGDDWAEEMPDKNADGAQASFDELGGGSVNEEGSQNLDFLLDIPLEVSVELGRNSLIINEMLQLAQGSVVELTKTAGEPVDIYVNQKLLGKGEVIVVNDHFGVRITEIISQEDRVKNMS